jgi:hypothetical protein
MKENKITPLTKFPTEALVWLYRKNRICRTYIPWDYHKSGPDEYWVPFCGPYEIEGVVYDPCIIGHTKMSAKEFHKKFTEINGNEGFYICDEPVKSKYINFEFEGMYWRGTVSELQQELSKRPHANIKGNKDFRKWKIKYKKQLKRK